MTKTRPAARQSEPTEVAELEEDLLLKEQVPPQLDGARLDVAAAKLFFNYSRSRIKVWIEAGALRLNGEVQATPRTLVNAGDALELQAEPEVSTAIEAQNIALDIVHLDKSIAVINKPAGFTVHPGAGQGDRTLQNALLHHFPQTAGVPRAGIVHRLDKDTSGLLVVALTLAAHTKLVVALSGREVRREYDALVQGTLVAGGTVNAPIGRHPNDRIKMAVVDRLGRDAVTHYRVKERFKHYTLLNAKLETGRTHQIRVHMSHIRHPIAGDTLYGGGQVRGSGMPEELRNVLSGFRRQALHARELELEHPKTGKTLSFSAEPPKDMQALLAALRQYGAA